MRYFIHIQNQNGIPFLFLFFILSLFCVFTGFFLRGFISFWFQESASAIIAFIDWFLLAGLSGLVISFIGVLTGAGYFLYKLRQIVINNNQNFQHTANFQYLKRPDQHSNS